MTFIELLELLVNRASLNEVEMKDARGLLDELKNLNAFGVVLGTTAKQVHECKYDRYTNRCIYCGKEDPYVKRTYV